MRGRLLVLEGLDGVGKTTVAMLLAERLSATLLSTPDASLRGARGMIDNLYSHSPEAAHLFYASCVAHASERAEEETSRGRDVVLDRYWLSTWAYDHVRGARLRLGELTRRLRAADFTFLLTTADEERRRRLAARGASAEDQKTLRPGVGTAIERRFRRGLRTRIAGTGVVLDLTKREPGGAVDDIISFLSRAQRP